MKFLDIVAAVLLVIGGLNWGSVGFFGFNVIDFIFGNSWVDTIIYCAVGVAAAYQIVFLRGICGRWHSSCKK